MWHLESRTATHARRWPALCTSSSRERLLTTGNSATELIADARTELRMLYESSVFDAECEQALDHLEAHPDRAGRGSCWDSFWSAWDSFAGAGSFDEAVRRAVAYGNDTDTTAAIAGGLAGIRWGIDGIPADWLAGMRGKDIAWPLIGELLGSAGFNGMMNA